MKPASHAASENAIDFYYPRVLELLRAVREEETESIEKSATLLAETAVKDQLIHVYGVGGHSIIGSEEMFWRAGGLACVNPLFESSLSLFSGGQKSTLLERTVGVGDKIIKAHALKSGEVLIITSIYGMNAATIDAALEAKSRGVRVVAVTSIDHASKTPPDFSARHPSRQNLYELADVVIDNHVPHGDAVVHPKGVSTMMGPVSTILVSFCLQWLVLRTTEKIVAAGYPAPVWCSANVPGGDEHNQSLFERYLPRVKAL